MTTLVRLNKFIADQTGVSRREADEMIAAMRVTVNGTTAVLGQQIDPELANVAVDGKLVKNRQNHTTILLNKPVGYLSSRRSQGGNQTVYDLLPSKYRALKTAGRLDRDSSGLMILSSDGDLIQQLTHPRYEKIKIYEVELDRPLAPLHQQMISDFGVELPDGKSQLELTETPLSYFSGYNGLDSPIGPAPDCAPGSANDTKQTYGRTNWRITMHEGRNRQIRRTFAALGYHVVKLHRTHLGPYALGNLGPGKFRVL